MDLIELPKVSEGEKNDRDRKKEGSETTAAIIEAIASVT